MNKYIYAPGKIIWSSIRNKFLLKDKDEKRYWVGYDAYVSFLKKRDSAESHNDWNNKIEPTKEELDEIAKMEKKYV